MWFSVSIRESLATFASQAANWARPVIEVAGLAAAAVSTTLGAVAGLAGGLALAVLLLLLAGAGASAAVAGAAARSTGAGAVGSVRAVASHRYSFS